MRPNSSNSRGLLGLLALAATAFAALVLKRTPAEAPADPIDPTTRYEPRDVHAGAVALTGAGLLLAIWLAILVIYPFFRLLDHEGPPAAQGMVLPPAPRLQADPPRDLGEFRARENAAMNSYGWVDRANGVVSIPIDRAMQIVAQRGIPPQPAPNTLTYFDPQVGTRRTGFEGKVAPEPR